MSINLRADNRVITKDGKYSFLLDNYSSGSTTISVINTDGFYINSYVLVGNIGSENTEILQVESVTPSTREIRFKNFTSIARGSGLLTVAISNGGIGYTAGDMLTVVQGAAELGVVWATEVIGGVVTQVSIATAGHGYSPAAGLATTGGTGTGCTIQVLSITPAVTDTTIYFSEPRSFIVGQPVTIMVGNSNVVRGTGTVATTGTDINMMTLSGTGVVGATYGDIVRVSDILKFPHAESTKVTVIPYNKIRFFRTNSPAVPNAVPKTTLDINQNKSITETTLSTISRPPTTTYTQSDDPSFVKTIDHTPPIIFEGAVALTEPMHIQVDDFYTVFQDLINQDGYGWYAFYNETNLTYSPISNPLPYKGFNQNTVKKMFEMFDSSMNTKDLRLITQSDRYNWLNEGLSYMTNELNMGNWEYTASEELQLNLQAGVSKYLLPEDFSDLLFVIDGHNAKLGAYNPTFSRSTASTLTYAIRGKFLTFYPTPSKNENVTVSYLKNSKTLSSLDDVIDLPQNAFYSVKDFMRYRAYQKLQNLTEATAAFAFFKSQVDNMKIYAINRDNTLDSWGILNSTNV